MEVSRFEKVTKATRTETGDEQRENGEAEQRSGRIATAKMEHQHGPTSVQTRGKAISDCQARTLTAPPHLSMLLPPRGSSCTPNVSRLTLLQQPA